MAIDPSTFVKLNVADTCAIWNVLSSRRLYSAANAIGCIFCCTAYVNYECLHKPRSTESPQDAALKARLQDAQDDGQFSVHHLDIDDLLDVEILEKRKQIGHGELSSIVFAKRTRQAFLTDDQKARQLSRDLLSAANTQTTPHLFGWLLFEGKLSDGDKSSIVSEHESFGRPLEPHFETAYLVALEYRLKSRA